MLVMLLIFWLARSPMRVAAGRIALTLAILTAITISCGTQGTTAIAEERLDRSKRIAEFEPAAKVKLNADLLREGTLIPPTVGRIVLLGRRWAFIPARDEPETNDDLVTSGADRVVSSMVSFTRKSHPTRLGAATTSVFASLDANKGTTLIGAVSSKNDKVQTALPQVLLVENLMLQRIADAIRADGSDDRWTVSGEVTEYYNENQLLIRTAQRAGSN